MRKRTYVTIMAGGIGSRFWPWSRQEKPKQFIDVLGTGRSLLQMTFDRFAAKFSTEDIFVITNANYVKEVREQLPEIGDWQIIGEPLRKNTAPCIAYTAFKFAAHDPDGLMVVSPADHLIVETDIFHSIIDKACDFASENDALLTLGIQPTRPDTGYGYIQYHQSNGEVKKVKTFTEKPTAEIAQSFLDSGDFLWNSGIFVWSFNSIKKAIKEHIPEIYDIFDDGKEKFHTEKEAAFLQESFQLCPNLSVDYGILEPAKNVHVIPSKFTWSDLGTWQSLFVNSDKNNDGNALLGTDIIARETTNSLVLSDINKKVVVLQNIDNLIVVDTKDALLIADKDNEQKIKQALSELNARKLDEYL